VSRIDESDPAALAQILPELEQFESRNREDGRPPTALPLASLSSSSGTLPGSASDSMHKLGNLFDLILGRCRQRNGRVLSRLVTSRSARDACVHSTVNAPDARTELSLLQCYR
jgi:hypothetical protein